MTRLSSDLITEVLSRLPPKSLLRFRCASKSLCNEIDGPEFINLHLRRSLESGPRQVLTFSSRGQVQLFEHLPDFPIKLSSGKDLTPQVRHLSGSPVTFIGSCRGLIALAIKGGGVVICNPFTRKRWIPPVPYNTVYPCNDFDTGKSSFGFGYDSVSGDYKLVRVDEWYQSHLSDFDVRVYSFKSNSWRSISTWPNPFRGLSVGQYGVLAHEAVHFVTLNYLIHGECEVYIKAFDLNTEKFRDLMVKLPSHEGDDVTILDVSVTVLGGHFSMVRFESGETEAGRSEMEAWVLKDYSGNEESWTKLFRVSLPWFDVIESIFMLDCGSRVLLHCYDRCFAWIDLEGMSVEEVRVKRIRALEDASLLVASMVSLGVGTADKRTFPEKRVQQNRKRRRVRRHGW